ncbi:MAG: biotin--[acetyl-CoA-carboxylase] ligase [Pseudomonadota bacterium]
MHPELQSLAHLLADGRFHSGQDMCEQLCVSRTTVWNLVRQLSGLGVMVDCVRGRGYKLVDALELLQPDLIQTHQKGARVPCDVLFDIDSSNRYLMTMAQLQPARTLHACFAEYQSAGRGRRGRTWVSPLGANLYGSVLRRFHTRPAALEGVSLVTALAVLRALQDLGIHEAGIKWPNDIYARGRKLAGILLEMGGEPSGACYIVAGVGVNVRMPEGAAHAIDQQWIDLAALTPHANTGMREGRATHDCMDAGVRATQDAKAEEQLPTSAGMREGRATQEQLPSISRNRLAGRLLARIAEAYDQFQRHGLDVFLEEWYRHDLTYQREVQLHTGDTTLIGTAVGIDAHGALLLKHDGRVQRYFSGDVSVRFASGVPQ